MISPRRPNHAFSFIRSSSATNPAPAGRLNTTAQWTLREALAVTLLFVVSQLGIALLVSLGLKAGLAGAVEAADRDVILGVSLPLVFLGSHALSWAAVYCLIRFRPGRRFGDMLALHPVAAGRLTRTFLAGMAMQWALLAVMVFFPPPADLEISLERFFRLGWAAKTSILLMAGAMAPLLEEVIFRGLLLSGLRRHLRFVPAALIVTALFTGLHTSEVGLYPPALAGIFLCGFALAWLREKRGSLWPPILFHMGFNLAGLIPLFLVDFLAAAPLS